MSVAHLTDRELASFAAIVHHLDLLPYEQLQPLCELIACGNRLAWAATYGDQLDPFDSDEFERELLHALADPETLAERGFGPLAYNCIANNGKAFFGVKPVEQSDQELTVIRQLEKRCQEWQEGKQREQKRVEENAGAFNEIGQLGQLSADEIRERCQKAGCQRVIVAEFMVDESDLYTDYHGGRTARCVVIGFGKGKRENFRQLRKAAGQFPPTAFMGPDRDVFAAVLKWDHNHSDDPNRAFIKFGDGNYSDQPRKGHSVRLHWWKDQFEGQCNDRLWGLEFGTRAEVDAFIESNPPLAGTYWDVARDSYEQRENYSMGGGNYLGSSRYSGWKVRSIDVDWSFGDSLEFFEPPKNKKRSRKPKPTKPVEPTPLQPVDHPHYTDWL